MPEGGVTLAFLVLSGRSAGRFNGLVGVAWWVGQTAGACASRLELLCAEYQMQMWGLCSVSIVAFVRFAFCKSPSTAKATWSTLTRNGVEARRSSVGCWLQPFWLPLCPVGTWTWQVQGGVPPLNATPPYFRLLAVKNKYGNALTMLAGARLMDMSMCGDCWHLIF